MYIYSIKGDEKKQKARSLTHNSKKQKNTHMAKE